MSINYKIVTRLRFKDKRGQLVEFLTVKETGNAPFGHIYFVTFLNPGVVRGNHYHKKKEEYFGMVQGKVAIYIENIFTKEKKKIILDANSKKFKLLKIGENVAHAVVGLKKNSILVDYFSSSYDPKNPDSQTYIVKKPKG